MAIRSTLPIVAPDAFTPTTWTLAAGTPVAGYGPENLSNGDPSNPCAIEETTIDLRGDQITAHPIDTVVLTMHNLTAGVHVRLQAAAAASWGGSTPVDLTIVVPPWTGRFARHLYWNVAKAVPTLATRTLRYLRVTNTDANGTPIAVGLLTVGRTLQALTRGLRGGLTEADVYGRSLSPSRAGVATVHDYRTRLRSWSGSIGLIDADAAILRTVHDACYGVRPLLVWPNDDTDEPVLARFAVPAYARQLMFPGLTEVTLDLEELSNGEAY